MQADARGAINGGHSFFRDLYASDYLNDFEARGRLERHMNEARAVSPYNYDHKIEVPSWAS